MVSESSPDVEGDVLRHIRAIPGLEETPLCGVLDLHANVSAAMARYSTGLIAYRENPHTDAAEAAARSAALLDRLMSSGERPITLWEHPAVMWPPTGTGTGSEPMRRLEQMARQFEVDDPTILAVNVFGGFSLADVPDAGVSFTAVALGDPGPARAALAALSAQALADRHAGNVLGRPLSAVMPLLAAQERGPVILIEPADNIGAGAPGDLTNVLAALLEHRVRDAGVVINDPAAVRTLHTLGPGTRLTLPIGGASGVVGAAPLTLQVELVSTSDGRFTLEDRRSHLASMYGEHIDMGPCAVVRTNGVQVLLTSRRMPPFDLGQWRSQGIQPERLFAIGVKAAVAHRRAYDPIAAASFLLETPGPCASDLRTLPFSRARRPIFPLDEQ
jgi:microcystin degradation protein MlrC